MVSANQAQTGIAVPELAVCDGLMQTFLSTYDIPGATFALAKNGKLVYYRGFGNADQAGTTATQPHQLFRIASLSKPVTSIGIMKLVEAGEISLSDKVFGTGGLLENHPFLSSANITDDRIYDITVQHLLEHTAGWNRDISCFPNPTSPYPWTFGGCDPISAPLHVTQENGTSNPATEEDMIYFLLEKGLDFTPGMGWAYSNIGYLVLGEIIETVSEMSYEEYMQSEVFSPLGICDMHLGRNLPSDRLEREMNYVGNGYTTLSCYGTGLLVPWEYGGFNVEAMDAHGGWVATARDLVRLLVAVDGFSTKPDILSPASIATMTTPSTSNSYYAKGWSVNPNNNWWHTGALDGTATFMARTSGGYTWAVLLNKRVIDASADQFWNDLDQLPWNCIANVTTYPTHDLMELPTINSDGISFSDLTNTSVKVSWNNGNGLFRMLVAKEGNGPFTAFPLDGIEYVGSTAFGLGDNLGDDVYAIYIGFGNNMTVIDLDPNKAYSFRLFDFNYSANSEYPLYMLCGSEPASVVTSVSANQEVAGPDGLTVYPTIAKEEININLAQAASNAAYQLYSMAGQLLQTGSLEGQQQPIRVAEMRAGIYLLKVENGEKVYWRRFVVK